MTQTSMQHLVMQGYLKKYKSSKKKYAVIRGSSYSTTLHSPCNLPAQLEFYESYRKFKENGAPRKALPVSQLFNVVRLPEKRSPYTFMLYMREEKLCLSASSEEEMMRWISAIETVREEEKCTDECYKNGKAWFVDVKRRCISAACDILGRYLFEITPTKINLRTCDRRELVTSFPILLVKNSGYTENVCFLELHPSDYFTSQEIWLDVSSNEHAEELHKCLQILSKPRSRTMDSLDNTKPQRTFRRTISESNLLDAHGDYFPCVGVMVHSDTNSSGFISDSCISPSSSAEIQDIVTPSTSSSYPEDIFCFEHTINENGNDIKDVESVKTRAYSADDESEPVGQYSKEFWISQSPEADSVFTKDDTLTRSHNQRQQTSPYKETVILRPKSKSRTESSDITDDETMHPVNLIRFKTDSETFGEPLYEKISRPSKGIRKSPRGSNHSTPEGSPILNGRKYKVSQNKKQAYIQSPIQPPLPKRNSNTSVFYASTDEYEQMDGFYGNNHSNVVEPVNTESKMTNESIQKSEVKISTEEPKYIDIETVERIRESLILDENSRSHGYTEIKPKPRPTSNRSRSVDHATLDREMVNIRYPAHTLSQQPENTVAEENEMSYENTTIERDHSYENTGRSFLTRSPPTRAKSVPIRLDNYEFAEVNIKDRDNGTENRSLHNNNLPAGYEYMSPANLNLNTSYDNVDSRPRGLTLDLSYADIDLHRSKERLVTPEEELPERKMLHSVKQQSFDKTRYTSIDFQKSIGIREAVKDARERRDSPDRLSPDRLSPDRMHKTDYLTDLSHKTFKKSS